MPRALLRLQQEGTQAGAQALSVRACTAVVVAAVVTVVALAVVLMTFSAAWAAGASLLPSARVLGIVAGVAAQTTLGNVFAGLQLAFTDALRLDDVMVVQDEWGRVEDVTLTYVVLALWDERRLVLPTSYFTTTPFQNWTRTGSRVLGEVLVHVDYSTPVEPVRQAAQRIVEGTPLWDRRDWVLQVVDTTPSTMVIRVLASAADAPSAYDLRCEVPEKLMDYLQASHPAALPRVRLTEQPALAAGPVRRGRRDRAGQRAAAVLALTPGWDVLRDGIERRGCGTRARAEGRRRRGCSGPSPRGVAAQQLLPAPVHPGHHAVAREPDGPVVERGGAPQRVGVSGSTARSIEQLRSCSPGRLSSPGSSTRDFPCGGLRQGAPRAVRGGAGLGQRASRTNEAHVTRQTGRPQGLRAVAAPEDACGTGAGPCR